MSAEVTITPDLEKAQLEVGSVVDKGGFGTVSRGRYKGTDVAVKTFQFSIDKMGPQQQKYLANEIFCAKKCNHPFVVKYVGFCDNPLMLVTEWVEGCALFDLVHSKWTYAWDFVRVFMSKVAHGLYHIHGNNIIHRDLKSLNIMVSNDYNPKIIDFGYSRMVDYCNTMSGGIVGTVQWIAPEVLREARYDTAADVYSVGIVLWEMCTRDYPFKGYPGGREGQVSLIHDITTKRIRPPLPEHIPEPFRSLIAACWTEDPAARPTVKRFVEILAAPLPADVARAKVPLPEQVAAVVRPADGFHQQKAIKR